MITHLRKPKITLCLIGFLTLFVIANYYIPKLHYKLIYQPTSSMPPGFYLMRPLHTIRHHQILIFRPPTTARNFLLKHHWIPNDGLLIKEVFAIPGDNVCIRQHAVWINDHRIAPVYQHYAPHHPLPKLVFCGKLRPDTYFLMSTRVKRSFDSRYFGSIHRNAIMGSAIKL